MTQQTQSATAVPAKPKYVVSGDSLEECFFGLAELALQVGQLRFTPTKSGNSEYAQWILDDGQEANSRMAGMHLDLESAKKLNTVKGMPLILSGNIVLRQLTPLNKFPTAVAERKAATIAREDTLLAQLNAVRRQQGKPEIK